MCTTGILPNIHHHIVLNYHGQYLVYHSYRFRIKQYCDFTLYNFSGSCDFCVWLFHCDSVCVSRLRMNPTKVNWRPWAAVSTP